MTNMTPSASFASYASSCLLKTIILATLTTYAESFQIQPLSIPTSRSSSSSGVSLHPLHHGYHHHQRRNDHVRFMSGTGAGTGAGTGGGNSEDDNLASLAFNTEGSTTSTSSSSSSSNTNTNDNSSSTTSTASTSSSIASTIEQALQEAKDLKERAAKERLEAEKMSIQLTLDKIASLEKDLQKIGIQNSMNMNMNMNMDTNIDGNDIDTTSSIDVPSPKEVINIAEKDFDPKMLKKSQDLQGQIQDLKKLLDVYNTSGSSSISGSSSSSSSSTIDTDTIMSVPTTSSVNTNNDNHNNEKEIENNNMDIDMDMNMNIPPMPEEVYQKRMEAFKRFSHDIKSIYAKAVGATEDDDIDTIVRKIYIQEQMAKIAATTTTTTDTEDDNDSDTTTTTTTSVTSLLDIANAQAGYSMLPPPIQEMIAESVGLSNERNTTAIIERLIDTNKVKPTGDFGGVEFAMGDIEDDDDDDDDNDGSDYNSGNNGGKMGGSKRGKDREFTPEEMKSAIDLFENLPSPMKTMLTKGIVSDDTSANNNEGESDSTLVDSTNSTAIIEAMIQQKKILPSSEGVEFVVFGNDNEDIFEFEEAMESFESDNYIRSMLPAVMRKESNMVSEEDADAFFAEVLGSKTFNPISRPERVPGGYIIRGDNRLTSKSKSTSKTSLSDELVAVLEKKLEQSSVAGKLQLHYIRDPTLVSEEQFETNSYELPVIMITGPNLSPDTNRFVKPLVTVLGGLCVATFSLAVCFANEDAVQDPLWLEQTASPLIISILMTQVAHEAAHQIVAFKDKFKTGAPTIVPSIQLGLTGCITPIKTPPPNFNSLFDFAIAGPLVGMILSLGLMYTGLEQQVFMDTFTQSQLPSLPVELVRSSSLAGGLVEWLLGDGVLLSPDPSALIRLHPLAIAGFVGLVANALSLLPIGNTDGGRIALSLFGRSISRVVRTGTIGLIVISSFFGGGDSMNILLFYTIYAQIWQRESEILSKNEIENVDDVRAITAFATGILVALTVIPMF